MKIIDLKSVVTNLNSSTVISLLQAVEINRGRTFALPKIRKLNILHNLSKFKSVTSSNEIEGIKVAKSREEEILIKNLTPDTKEEMLLVGYNAALENIFETYKYQTLSESFILDLHYYLYKDINPSYGGKYKTSQNYIREVNSKGDTLRTVFIPASPEETPSLMGNLIYQFNECINDPNCNTLLTIFVFILDFLCIHPFGDGNGRVSRLLTTYLLMKYGYDLDQYYSISYVILNNVESYYRQLENSSKRWKDSKNNYEFFVLFMLNCLKEGYEKLSYIIDVNSQYKFSYNKIEKVVNDSKIPLTKNNIEEILFTLSKTTIEKTLNILLREKKIQMVQSGKYAKYYKI